MLPIHYSDSRDLTMVQTTWAAELNPLLSMPQSQGIILKNVSLSNGSTTINHRLQRMLQGWQIVDVNGAATIYRSQPKNILTLTLTSNAAVTADIFVF